MPDSIGKIADSAYARRLLAARPELGLELAAPAPFTREEMAAALAGAGGDDALAAARERLGFTTHTPVPAGNETYGRDEVLHVLGELAAETGDP